MKNEDKGSRKRKYSSSSDESDSDSDEDSSSEDSDIDSLKEEISQNVHTSSRFPTKSSAKKNKWTFSKQLNKRAKAIF